MSRNGRSLVFISLISLLVLVAAGCGQKSPKSRQAIDRAGQRVAVPATGSRVTMIHFWGTWCGPCRGELPTFTDFVHRHEADGIRLVAVARDGSFDDVDRYFSQSGLQFDTLLDPTGGVLNAWGVDSIPTTIVLDRNGKELARYVGMHDWGPGEHEDAVMKVVQGAN